MSRFQEASDLERALDVGQLVARQRQVALCSCPAPGTGTGQGCGHQADQVVLVCEGDEDVLTFPLQAQASSFSAWPAPPAPCRRPPGPDSCRCPPGQAHAAAVVHQATAIAPSMPTAVFMDSFEIGCHGVLVGERWRRGQQFCSLPSCSIRMNHSVLGSLLGS